MKDKTYIVKTVEAGMIQSNAAQFACEVSGIGFKGKNFAQITISGSAANIDRLLKYVYNSIKTGK